MIVLSILGWTIVGAAIGYHAAPGPDDAVPDGTG
jgi:hypothetical protein